MILKLIEELIKGFGFYFTFFVLANEINGRIQVGEYFFLFGGKLFRFDHFDELQAFEQFPQEGDFIFVLDI